MTEQTQILAEAIDKALEIIERNIHQKIDAAFSERFDALHEHSDLETDAAEKHGEEEIRSWVRSELKDAINSGEIEVNADLSM